MKKILLALALFLAPSACWAQCSGVFPANTVCGNLGASPATPSAVPFSGGVIGPGSSTVDDLPYWANSAGTQLGDTGILYTRLLFGPLTTTPGDIAVWNNSTGTLLKDVAALQIFGTELANCVFAGPTSGSAAFPTCRSLVAADLPTSIPYANLATIGTSTVLGNFSGSTTTPSAQSVPSCINDGAHALTNNSGSGFNCTANTYPLGQAVMYPNISQSGAATSPWIATDPYGRPINCASTHSQCLNEFLAATTSNGWPAAIYCGAIPYTPGSPPTWDPNGQNVIDTTVTIQVPVAQDWNFHAYGCVLNAEALGSEPLMIIDSEGASVFDWEGVTVYGAGASNTGICSIELAPDTHTEDGFAGIYAGSLTITNPVDGVTGSGVVCINVNNGSVGGHITMYEVNAADAASYGVLVQGESATTGIMNCYCVFDQIHGSTSQAILEGTTTSNQSTLTDNQWFINNIDTASGRGVDTYGNHDQWYVNDVNGSEGSITDSFITESGANYNLFINGIALGTPKVDNGVGNMWIGESVGETASPCSSPVAVGGTIGSC